MALHGTIKDFGLADILQLIGIQRKTGVLTLESGDEGVTIKFVDGQIVGADTRSASVEDLLGAVLVRTGGITESQLQGALRLQKKTLQRLGYVLVQNELISQDNLVEALRVQSLQIVYRLFRWREGAYNFQPSESLEYDDQHFTPISAETILMEGARMIDEWPIIERRIKSDGMVLRQTEAAAALESEPEPIVDIDLRLDIDLPFGDTAENDSDTAKDDEQIKLTSDEREVLALVDGKRRAEEINDRSTLGEFDTYRILAELITRNLIEEVERPTIGAGVPRRNGVAARLFQIALYAVLLAAVVASLGTLPDNPFVPWRIEPASAATTQLRISTSQARLQRLEKAVQVYFLNTGNYPQHLDAVGHYGYVAASDLVDPWGRDYGYLLSAGGFQVFGLDADGEPSADLTVQHPFSTVQRLMVEDSSAAEGPASESDPEL
jgi:hypothetical protein